MIDSNAILSVSEANQNFSRAARIADRRGSAVIFKNNRPKYLLIDVDQSPLIDLSEEETLEFVAQRILKQHRAAFEELAK